MGFKTTDQKGAVAVIVGLCMIMFISFAAISIDLGHLFVAKNELQNAADAGALAGAQFLYDETYTFNPGAITRAYNAARDNLSENIPVDLYLNTGDIQVGHYDPFTPNFTATEGPFPATPIDLWDLPVNFINAIKVTARRSEPPVASFFARIFGHEDFEMSAYAIAYLGFAGTLAPHDVDQPIAICRESLLNGDTCNIGRMINSGQDTGTSETGGWTDFTQPESNCSGTNATIVKELICASGNPDPINFGETMTFNNGAIQSGFSKFYDCWVGNSFDRTQPWAITLPVVQCESDENIEVENNCKPVRGAVTVNVVWVTGPGEDPSYNDAPYQMGEWNSADGATGEQRWADFVGTFNLKNQDGTDAPYAKKSIYLLPDCTPQYPRGNSGGEDFGIFARSPVLVE